MRSKVKFTEVARTARLIRGSRPVEEMSLQELIQSQKTELEWERRSSLVVKPNKFRQHLKRR